MTVELSRSYRTRISRHVWDSPRSLIVGEHGCYFCTPELYPTMPFGHTLCARCGGLIVTGSNDPMNNAGHLCAECDKDVREEVFLAERQSEHPN